MLIHPPFSARAAKSTMLPEGMVASEREQTIEICGIFW
jgi:hypothetical protein